MGEYLPEVYRDFRERYAEIAAAQGQLSRTVRDSTPFDERTTHLLKFALALGAEADGAVRSNVRRASTTASPRTSCVAWRCRPSRPAASPTAIAGLSGSTRWWPEGHPRPTSEAASGLGTLESGDAPRQSAVGVRRDQASIVEDPEHLLRRVGEGAELFPVSRNMAFWVASSDLETALRGGWLNTSRRRAWSAAAPSSRSKSG